MKNTEPVYKRYGVGKQIYFSKKRWEKLQEELAEKKIKWSSKYVISLIEKDLKLTK